MKINEIFFSIQGEGQYIGLPMAFIRISGCNLRCNWCDTKYAYDEGFELGVDEILKKIHNYSTKYVCVTGGEPLANSEINQLLEKLLDSGYTILLETNGSFPINTIPKSDSIKTSLDIKCPSSGEEAKMDLIQFLKIMEMEERAAYAKYQWAMDQTDNEDLIAIFERLRDEEAVHADYLQYERAKLEKLLAEE